MKSGNIISIDELNDLSTISNKIEYSSWNISSSIENFIMSDNLKGTAWSLAKNKLQEYNDSCVEMNKIFDELNYKITSSISILKPFFESNQCLDTSKIDEIASIVDELKNRLSNISEFTFSKLIDSVTGDEIIKKEINPYFTYLENRINELEIYLNFLIDFETTCNNILENFQGTFKEIDEVDVKINNIVPSETVSFKK